jgi:hypothetical protein
MNLVNDYGAILTILTLFTGAAVYLYSTSKRGRVDIVRQDNADLRSSNQELRTEKAGYVATITQQTDTIKNLRDVATQTPAVTKLLELTAYQQKITNKQHIDVIKQLSDLTIQMSKMTESFSVVAQALGKNSTAQDKNRTSREAQR